jgi:opacity protein-like surface antigen
MTEALDGRHETALRNSEMRNSRCRGVAALAFSALAGIASARPDIPWDGFYFGAHVGDTLSSTCDHWALTGAIPNPGAATEISSLDCSNGGALVAGVNLGENFQFGRLVWGVGGDLDYSRANALTQSLKYSSAVPPPRGAYSFSNKSSPGGFAVIAPRIGYGGDTWLPYLTAGAIIAIGSHDSTLFYSPTGGTKPSASFDGGSNFSAVGWVSGAGVELGLNGAWAISAEYLHANFGKGSASTTNCVGSASSCAAFSGINFDTDHDGYRANIIRIGVTYWFDYW